MVLDLTFLSKLKTAVQLIHSSCFQLFIVFFSAEEMHHWIDCLQPDGGCNVMSAVRHAVKRWDVDCVILILGNW